MVPNTSRRADETGSVAQILTLGVADADRNGTIRRSKS